MKEHFTNKIAKLLHRNKSTIFCELKINLNKMESMFLTSSNKIFL